MVGRRRRQRRRLPTPSCCGTPLRLHPAGAAHHHPLPFLRPPPLSTVHRPTGAPPGLDLGCRTHPRRGRIARRGTPYQHPRKGTPGAVGRITRHGHHYCSAAHAPREERAAERPRSPRRSRLRYHLWVHVIPHQRRGHEPLRRPHPHCPHTPGALPAHHCRHRGYLATTSRI